MSECGALTILPSCSSCIGGALPSCITYNSAQSRFEVISNTKSDANFYIVALTVSNIYNANT